ncbi:hypothetical protein F5J12DRAFT_784493 [Pisolithus orientalis]|uniref:uncharacterized protein n=1 Tax=Pisolithus orientalis TaxID=936130 RepID=UPI002225673E|nr:uncharacterized protein F5J12DRAFT_784493 [Pisolithus orientalis]KAI6000185.1 hypothetical protein F5J12DRAFT_784493 [Pisolithus orientalis]
MMLMVNVGEREEERFEVEELEILGHQHQEWRQAGKKKKPAVLLSIWEEMQQVDRNKELRGRKVQTKYKLIQDWLKKPLHSKKPHIALRSSYKYSVWAVVHKLYQEQIQEKLAKMKVGEGNIHGSKQIQQYQNALMALIQDDLMEGQLAAAEDIAERWNGWEGPVPETKARNAAKYGYNMDFNHEIMDGIPFNDVHTPEGSWQEYLGETFEEPRTLPKHDVAKAMRTGKVDSVKLVKNADGEIWIGEITGLSQDQLQKMLPSCCPSGASNRNPIQMMCLDIRNGSIDLVVRQWKYQKTPAPKCKKNPGKKNVKGKGKAQEERVVDDSTDDSADDSMDDSLDDHGEAEVSGRSQNHAKTPFPSCSHSNPPPADGSHVLTDYNGWESNSHDSHDEADEDTYLPTLSNSKKMATSLNTNPHLHSGNKYTTELQDHSEYTDEDG